MLRLPAPERNLVPVAEQPIVLVDGLDCDGAAILVILVSMSSDTIRDPISVLNSDPNGRVEQDFWYRGDYFYVKADQLANFKLDLKRVKFIEKLKMVQLITFEKTKDLETKVIGKWHSNFPKSMGL